MPRVSTDKTIQVSAELHEHIRQLADNESKKLNLPKPMSMAAYLQRKTGYKKSS